jgi:hypothetical protein
MKKISLLLLIVIIQNIATAQNNLNSALLKEDLTIVGNIATGLSPKLTAEDRSRIEQLIELKKKELDGKVFSSIDFFKFLSKIDFQTKFDEHASMSITEEVLMPLLTESKLFPLPIKILETNTVINSAKSEIPYGSKIYSINGLSIDSLLRSFTRNFDDTHSKRRLERQFSIIFLILKGSFETFEIEYTTQNNPDQKLNKSISGIDFEEYRSVFSKTVFPLEQDKLKNLINTQFYQKSSTYFLQLNSFNWDNSSKKGILHFLNSEHKNFEKKFDIIFEEISDYNAENLIIDLRFNTGGNVKVPGILYSYITDTPFLEDIRITIPDFEIPNTELITKISGDEIDNPKEVQKFIKQYKKQFTEQSDQGYLWRLVDNTEVQPSKNSFNGNVYLLVSGRSISASAYFAALIKSNQRGLIIGEEMGGSYKSLSAGQILTYQLPNTKLELEAPIMEVNFSDQINDKINSERIKPDIKFTENDQFIYFIEKKDIEIEKTLELIETN